MASRSINKVVLLGNLTRDPEVKYTPSGAAVCSFGLATNRTWTTAEGQTKEDLSGRKTCIQKLHRKRWTAKEHNGDHHG
jgi:single stranded DNA-binding protein